MATFASDAFAGTAGTELSVYSASWSKQSGYTINGFIGNDGQYAFSADAGSYAVYQHSGSPASADYDVSADIAKRSGTTSPQIAVCGRMASGASTFYWLVYTHSSTNLRLFKMVGGSATQLGSSYSLTLTSTPQNIKLRMVGDQISGYLDGALVIGPTTDAAITANGKSGILMLAMRETGVADSGSLDNFLAEDAGGGGSAVPLLMSQMQRMN